MEMVSYQSKPLGYYDSQEPRLEGVIIFFIVLATSTVLFRIISQVKLHRRLFWDDVFIIISMVWDFTSRCDCAVAVTNELYHPFEVLTLPTR